LSTIKAKWLIKDYEDAAFSHKSRRVPLEPFVQPLMPSSKHPLTSFSLDVTPMKFSLY